MLACRAVLILAGLAALAGPVRAAEPPRDPGAFACKERDRAVATAWQPALRYFAEARPLPAAERSQAAQRGLSGYVIRINRDIYYLGPATQRWLYQRQCARLQNPELYGVTEAGDAPLNDVHERELDCAAMRATAQQTGASLRMLVSSIESDMERLSADRWSTVLPGPQRRLNLATCPGQP